MGALVLLTQRPAYRIQYDEMYAVGVISLGTAVLLIHQPEYRIETYGAYAMRVLG